MTIWFYSLFGVLIVSLISFAGVLFLVPKKVELKKLLLFLVSLAAGALLGDVFLHLLPEVVEEDGFSLAVSLAILAGFLGFFVLEKFICWQHCHIPTDQSHPHSLGFMNLVGDGLHNLIDGALIAGSFLTSVPLGVATLLAVILHEIPQEIGDFGILIYAGFSKNKALLFNFISALTAVLGAILVLLIGSKFEGLSRSIVAFTAGGFIYIVGADLIPELKKETSLDRTLRQMLGLVLGVILMLFLALLPTS